MSKPDIQSMKFLQRSIHGLTIFVLCFVIGEVLFNGSCLAGELPASTGTIRNDHPRLFFNTDTWPHVKERALGAERQWYNFIKGRVDSLVRQVGDRDALDVKEYGQEAAWAAFIYLMTEEQEYFEVSKKCLDDCLCGLR